MSTSKPGVFYGTLIAFVSLVAGMVLASRLDLTPASFAGVIAAAPPPATTPLTGPLDASTFRTIAHDESPTVVSVLISGHRQGQSLDQLFPGLTPPGRHGGRGGGSQGGQGSDEEIPVEGAGSGFIIDKSGLILTNDHVIEDADTIAVRLSDMGDTEEGLPAKVVGRDKFGDVALLQLTELPKTTLPEAKLGDSSQMAAGDWVMAIGNPFELSGTVTVGVVSSAARPIPRSQSLSGQRSESMIQTDAAINRGNSGGPLLNIHGEVIGINTLIYTEANQALEEWGDIGIGFAIPINSVRDILPGLKTGKVARGRIGVSVAILKAIPTDIAEAYGLPGPSGALVSYVAPSGPGDAAGVKVKDVIVDFNGKVVHDDIELVNLVMATPPGTMAPVKVYRDRKVLTLTIKVGELDLDAESAPATNGSAQPQQGAPMMTRRLPDQPGTRTSMGIFVADVDPALARQLNLPSDTHGALVTDVDPHGDAVTTTTQLLGPGDVITEVDDHAIANAKEAADALGAVPAGHTARLIVWSPSRSSGPNLVLVKKH